MVESERWGINERVSSTGDLIVVWQLIDELRMRLKRTQHFSVH
jgi:hypothetical protein